MEKPNKGHKHTCSNCKARFYDLLQLTATCPKCGTVDQTETGKEAVAVALALETESELEAVASPCSPEKDPLDLDLDLDDDADEDADEDDDSLMEDTSDLSSIEDDVHGVIDHIQDTDGLDG